MFRESDEINLPHNDDGDDYDGDGSHAGAEADSMQEIVLYILDVDPERKVSVYFMCRYLFYYIGNYVGSFANHLQMAQKYDARQIRTEV